MAETSSKVMEVFVICGSATYCKTLWTWSGRYFFLPGAASHLPGAPILPPAKNKSPLHVQRNLQ